MPRGRPRINPADDPGKPQRARRSTVLTPPEQDSFTETKFLVAAILRSRGVLGATPGVLQKVVAWARSVRAETELLRDLADRQRRPRTGTEPDRVMTNEMNRALLDGVLDGSIRIQVSDDGGFTFSAAASAPEFREMTVEEITGTTPDTSGE